MKKTWPKAYSRPSAQGVDEATLVEYLRTPKLMGLARQEAQRTLRFIIAYRLLRDLRRGWRFNNPNLDQLGLLQIRYWLPLALTPASLPQTAP